MRAQTPVSHVSFSAAPKMAREVPRRVPVRQQRRGPESEIFLLVLLALLIGAVIYRAFFH
jgi:hypothetical protein